MDTNYLLMLDGRETYIQERDLLRPGISVTEELKTRLFAEYEEDLLRFNPRLFEDAKGIAFAEKLKNDYLDFLREAQDGDIMCDFDNFPFSPPLSGRAGTVILRDGKIVGLKIDRMS